MRAGQLGSQVCSRLGLHYSQDGQVGSGVGGHVGTKVFK